MLGVPGLMRAYRGQCGARQCRRHRRRRRQGGLRLHAADHPLLPRRRTPILHNVETHICREPDGLRYTLDHLAELVVKPVGEAGGYGITIGPKASRAGARGMPREARSPTRPTTSASPASSCRSRRPWSTAEVRAAPRRSAAVRDHRREDLGAAGRAHAGGAAPAARWSSTRPRAAARRIPGSLTDTLLARYAECIFWLARYVERAENLARILDVNETFSRDSRGAQDWLLDRAAERRRGALLRQARDGLARAPCSASM